MAIPQNLIVVVIFPGETYWFFSNPNSATGDFTGNHSPNIESLFDWLDKVDPSSPISVYERGQGQIFKGCVEAFKNSQLK